MKDKIIILIFILNIFTLHAQTTGEFGSDVKSMLGDKLKTKSLSLNKIDPNEMPVGDIIDPDLYIVGPNDRFTLKILPFSDEDAILKITADNNLILPRNFGIINLNNKTLKETISIIKNKITELNSETEVYVTLLKPRSCLVSVEGNIKNVGTYTLPASYRVSTLLKIANSKTKETNSMSAMAKNEKIFDIQKEKQSNYDNTGMTFKKTFFERNIKIFTQEGDIKEVDLIKSKLDGFQHLNPFIRGGDRIIVPFDKPNFPTISITGEVNNPLILHYKKGDKVDILLKNSYGFTSEADLNNVYLNYPDGKTLKLEFNNDNSLKSENIDLSYGSIINVGALKIENNDNIGIVSINGEVHKEGNYIVKNNITTIKEILERAGGFTEDAYLPLAHIIRNDNKNSILDDPMKNFSVFFQNSDLTVEDTMRFNLDAFIFKPTVTIDFTKTFIENNDEQNVTLQNGDIIVIPKNPNRIYIFGRVNNPGYIQFQRGKSLDWYVNKANGYTNSADIDRARIIRANTYVWIEPGDDVIVYDGDMIYIPSPPQFSKTTEVMENQTYISAVGAIAGLGYLIVALLSFFKN